MSREIKFRVWDKKNKKYRELGVYDVANGKVVVRLPIETLLKGDYILEQYTGLKDKNGKEIYEGDIIESWYLNGDGNGGNYEVVFKNGAFGVTRKNDFYTFDEIEWDEIEWDELEDIKVIGNIHKNQDLSGGEE